MANRLRVAVIMAGGEGVRLRPLTYAVPKPLLPLGDFTVIEFLIRGLAAEAVEQVHVLASYQFDKFRRCLEYGPRYGVDITLTREDERMGTVGGVADIRDRLAEPFLLLNADIVLQADFQAMYARHVEEGAALTLGVIRYESQVPYGVVSTRADGSFAGLQEKPSQNYTISVGANIVDPRALDHLPGGRADLPGLVADLHAAGERIVTYELEGLWLDVGRATDYERAIDLLASLEED